jgi:hypothetical protein
MFGSEKTTEVSQKAEKEKRAVLNYEVETWIGGFI